MLGLTSGPVCAGGQAASHRDLGAGPVRPVGPLTVTCLGDPGEIRSRGDSHPSCRPVTGRPPGSKQSTRVRQSARCLPVMLPVVVPVVVPAARLQTTGGAGSQVTDNWWSRQPGYRQLVESAARLQTTGGAGSQVTDNWWSRQRPSHCPGPSRQRRLGWVLIHFTSTESGQVSRKAAT